MAAGPPTSRRHTDFSNEKQASVSNITLGLIKRRRAYEPGAWYYRMVCSHGAHAATAAGPFRHLFFTYRADGRLPRHAPTVSRHYQKPTGQSPQRED